MRNGSGDTSGAAVQAFKLFVLVESNGNLDAEFAELLGAVMRGLLAQIFIAAGSLVVDRGQGLIYSWRAGGFSLITDRLATIGTDHAPHTIDEKQRSYTQAPSGMPVIQSAMPAAVFNYLIAQKYEKAPEVVAGMVIISTVVGFVRK